MSCACLNAGVAFSYVSRATKSRFRLFSGVPHLEGVPCDLRGACGVATPFQLCRSTVVSNDGGGSSGVLGIRRHRESKEGNYGPDTAQKT